MRTIQKKCVFLHVRGMYELRWYKPKLRWRRGRGKNKNKEDETHRRRFEVSATILTFENVHKTSIMFRRKRVIKRSCRLRLIFVYLFPIFLFSFFSLSSSSTSSSDRFLWSLSRLLRGFSMKKRISWAIWLCPCSAWKWALSTVITTFRDSISILRKTCSVEFTRKKFNATKLSANEDWEESIPCPSVRHIDNNGAKKTVNFAVSTLRTTGNFSLESSGTSSQSYLSWFSLYSALKRTKFPPFRQSVLSSALFSSLQFTVKRWGIKESGKIWISLILMSIDTRGFITASLSASNDMCWFKERQSDSIHLQNSNATPDLCQFTNLISWELLWTQCWTSSCSFASFVRAYVFFIPAIFKIQDMRAYTAQILW